MRCNSSLERDEEAGRSKTDRHARSQAEYSGLCQTLRQLLVDDALPPDEAYWWTLIALEEHLALSRLGDSDSPPGSSVR
jgi:hypothetical protein